MIRKTGPNVYFTFSKYVLKYLYFNFSIEINYTDEVIAVFIRIFGFTASNYDFLVLYCL